MSRITERRGSAAVAAALVAGVLAVGCGDDDPEPSPSGTAGATTPGAGQPEPGPPAATDEPAPEEEPEEERPQATASGRTPSPEEAEGGAGDEEPIRTEVVLRGRNGRVAPSRARVAPFIAVRVVLRSADGGRYSLTLGGKTLTVGPARRRAAVDLGGLRSGRRYVGRGPTGSVTVEASAEPGP